MNLDWASSEGGVIGLVAIWACRRLVIVGTVCEFVGS